MSAVSVPANVQAVIFDLDGTLVDSMPFHDYAWRMAMESHSIPVSSEDVYGSEGEKSETFLDRIFARECERLPTDAERAAILEEKEKAFSSIFSLRLFPGAIAVLEALRGAGLPLALVSGSRKIRERYAGVPELLNPFSAIVTGDDVSLGKPDPEPFRTASSLLGIPAASCLVVENAPFGIIAAKRAGMRCWAVRNGSPLTAAYFESLGAEQVFETIADLTGSKAADQLESRRGK